MNYPPLYPALPATPVAIQSDLDTHGCAYVIEIGGGEKWLAHPNNVTVYGTPKKVATNA